MLVRWIQRKPFFNQTIIPVKDQETTGRNYNFFYANFRRRNYIANKVFFGEWKEAAEDRFGEAEWFKDIFRNKNEVIYFHLAPS